MNDNSSQQRMTRRKNVTPTKSQSTVPWSISQLETIVNGVKERGVQSIESDSKALQHLSSQLKDDSKTSDTVKEVLCHHQKLLSRPDVTPQLLLAALEEHQRSQEVVFAMPEVKASPQAKVTRSSKGKEPVSRTPTPPKQQESPVGNDTTPLSTRSTRQRKTTTEQEAVPISPTVVTLSASKSSANSSASSKAESKTLRSKRQLFPEGAQNNTPTAAATRKKTPKTRLTSLSPSDETKPTTVTNPSFASLLTSAEAFEDEQNEELDMDLDDDSTASDSAERKLTDKTETWLAYEWLYSPIDVPYYRTNEYVCCISETLNSEKIPNMPRGAWNTIRQEIGKPRRFSSAFTSSERLKLAASREDLAILRKVTSISHANSQVPPQLTVGSSVIAFHPMKRKLMHGKILQVLHLRYLVHFEQLNQSLFIEESDVICTNKVSGTEHEIEVREPTSPAKTPSRKIIYIKTYPSPQISTPKQHERTSPNESRILASTPRSVGSVVCSPSLTIDPVQKDILLRRTAMFWRVLIQKNELINKITEMNKSAQQFLVDSNHDVKAKVEFQQEYATLVVQLKKVNGELLSVLPNLLKARSDILTDIRHRS
eukprot:TRINITY_DN3949_c0_g1_i1.p1 TRINITY_DN3949_c0_g1~~TRINITY_DN3949_c0_g1_i1.p1  ORF type:complete len:598 (-),score=106.53 TRINITY_DN3949_c0_g1_i1:269-2062(-)